VSFAIAGSYGSPPAGLFVVSTLSYAVTSPATAGACCRGLNSGDLILMAFGTRPTDDPSVIVSGGIPSILGFRLFMQAPTLP